MYGNQAAAAYVRTDFSRSRRTEQAYILTLGLTVLKILHYSFLLDIMYIHPVIISHV